MQNRRAYLLFICSIILSISLSGQKLVNSPYARFNLGAIEPAGSFRSIAMGGIGTAIRDNSAVYYLNPASYSSIDTNSFVFDFGLDYGINYLSDGSNHHFSDDMNFDHIILGFPLSKGLGFAVGLVPFSNGYYNIKETVSPGDPGNTIDEGYISSHKGQGSLSKFFVGSGVNITKYFSAGINMSLIFGNIQRLNEVDFTDYYYMFHNSTTEKIQLYGINFEYGAQIIAPLKNSYFITAGISYSTDKHYNFRYENLAFLFSAYNILDTLYYISNSQKAYLPGSLRAGISFGKRNKLTAGFDFSQTDWAKAVISSSGASFGNSRSYRFGAEYIPDKFSNYSFAKKMEYRIGGHFEETYLVINGEQIKEYGFSLGVGVPMSRTLTKTSSLSKTNFFFDFSQRCGPEGSLLPRENIFTVGASLNLYDFWFLKRKYE
jgi:hypothetical protein